VSVGRTFVQFYGFRVTWNGARLLRECGLLTTRRQVLHATRIQRILIRQRWLQRWLDCVSIELGTAASASGDGGDKGRKFVIPIVPVSGVQPILDLLAPGAEPIDGQFERVSPLASRRYLVRSALAFLPVSAGVAFWQPWAAPLVWIGFVRNLIRAPRLAIVGGSRATGELVQFRSGAFSRRLVTLPLRRVQGISLERTVFDRRLGLATLRVFGAGSGNAGWLRDLPEERARALAAAVVAGAPGADPRAG
jgi:putative membrane protein